MANIGLVVHPADSPETSAASRTSWFNPVGLSGRASLLQSLFSGFFRWEPPDQATLDSQGGVVVHPD